jgi:hypothetical protein
MSRKTLHEFAELHASTEMRRWRDAHAAHRMRALSGDEGEADPANREDHGNVAAEAEAEIEAVVLAEILNDSRYAIEGRRNGVVERLRPFSMNRLRLALDTAGVIEIDQDGRTANAWSDCDVIDEETGCDDAQPASGVIAPNVAPTAKGRKPVLGNRTEKFLEECYPDGKPDDVTYETIRAEMKASGRGVPSDKVIREAFKKLAQKSRQNQAK